MLIVDTGVLVAAADRTDPHHDTCSRLLTTEPQPLVTTGVVIAETAYLLDHELGPGVEALLYQSILDGGLHVEPLIGADWQRSHDLVTSYTTYASATPTPASSRSPSGTFSSASPPSTTATSPSSDRRTSTHSRYFPNREPSQ